MSDLKIGLMLLFLLPAMIGYSQLKYTYKEHREPNSKLILFGVNYTMEKLKNGKCVYKTYYPELRVMTQKVTFTSRKSGIKDGPYLERYDNGKIFMQGEFVNDKKQGEWKEHDWKGNYEQGEKVGEWTRYDHKERVTAINHFSNNKLDGEQITYDTLGQVKDKSVYENGVLISTTADTTDLSAYESMPRFAGCEEVDGTDKDKKMCADKKMLTYVYQNIKYPKKARKQEIDGTALVRFIISKEGDVEEIVVLRGLCDDIKEECYRVVSNMPRWTPGYQKGEPVRVQFNLPIKFRLK